MNEVTKEEPLTEVMIRGIRDAYLTKDYPSIGYILETIDLTFRKHFNQSVMEKIKAEVIKVEPLCKSPQGVNQ